MEDRAPLSCALHRALRPDSSSRVVPAGRAGQLSPTGTVSFLGGAWDFCSKAELREGRGLSEALGLTGQWFPHASTSTDRVPDPARQLRHSTKSRKWSLSQYSAFTDIVSRIRDSIL